MSDTRHQRFEIDLDEIERQLRRSVENTPVASQPKDDPKNDRNDPLAELARIVGQDDPFRNILGTHKAVPSAPAAAAAPPSRAAAETGSELTPEEFAVLHGEPSEKARDERFDPVADAYGSVDNAFDAEDLEPLRPRRSRGRLAALAGVLAVAMAGVAGAVAYRNTGGSFNFSGVPPIIKADTAPTKVAPENPGGIEIPDQNKQIYERGNQDGRSRVVDRQEQPLDVREAVRSLPAPPAPSAPDVAGPAASAQAPASGDPAPRTNPSLGAPSSSVANALGEPRRVRTVAVRPDGTTLAPGGQPSAEPAPVYIPATGMPPPVSVPTVTIPANPQSRSAALPAAVEANPDGATPPAVTVLPPQRPRADPRGATATPASPVRGNAPTRPADQGEATADGAPLQIGGRATRPAARVAAAPQPAVVPDAPEASPASPTRGGFSVQIASQSTEQQARTSYDQLSDRYATELGGKPATVTSAKVGGKTVYRVRVGPLSRADANTLCTRLKASGGDCRVSAN